MSPEQRDELEQMAGEYALGTLAGDERLRFEQALAREPWLQRAVDDWNRRLGPLVEAVAPVAPPRELWHRIAAQIAPAAPALAVPSLWDRLSFWRWTSIGAAAAAAALLIYVATGPRPAITPDHVVVLHDAQSRPAVVVVANVEARRVSVQQLASVPTGRVHELWLISAPGQPPRSLGVITPGAARPHSMPADVAAALPNAAALAVSVEPPGGSPTGQPTGPVVFTGMVAALSR